MLYLISFIYAIVKFVQFPDLITPFNMFCSAGLLSFSLAVAYWGVIQINLMDFTRRTWVLGFIAGSWALFSTTLKIYPWNILLALFWLLLGLLISRRSKWELVEESIAREEQS
jgi:hypothetical protein